jgi:4Fe-4S ferredoxin
MEIKRDVKLEDVFTFFQETEDELRELIYDYRRCNGCGICVFACPVSAIDLGPIHDIALGLDIPPVIVDHVKCAYCGICYAFCPFDCFEFRINGEKVERSSLPISPISYTYKYEEKCVECTLCSKVCPTNAIKREIVLRRQDINLRNEGLRGDIKIDYERCNQCGICAEFCDVFAMVERDPKPFDIMPYEKEILIDKEKCDFCKLCEEVCPEKAIKIEGGERVRFELPEEIAKINIDQDLCSNCSYCEKICPYNAVKTIKPAEGELSLFEARMYRCDPVGCSACIKICKHNNVWYVSKDKSRVEFNEEFCIYCGACENSCPYDLINVERKNIFTKELIRNLPWRDSWENAVKRILSKNKVKEARKFIIEEEEEEVREDISFIDVDKEKLKLISLKLEKIEDVLKRPAYRRAVEFGNPQVFLSAVKKHISAKEMKNGKLDEIR